MLEVKQLKVTFNRYDSSFWQHQLTTIKDLSLSVGKREIVGVVGASGSGKSLLAHAVLGILPHNAMVDGEIIYKGEPLTQKRKKALRGKEITLIPQSVGFLNPLVKIGAQMARSAKLAGQKKERRAALVQESLERYGLRRHVASLFPFQLSGGMARRVLTAMATIGSPELIVADEPTTGLDMAVAKESLRYLRGLADQGKGVLLITHDIKAALEVVDTVVVFRDGQTVEIASASDFKSNSDRLRHPYTRALWKALPQNGFCLDAALQNNQTMDTAGCTYASNCRLVQDECRSTQPPLLPYKGGHVRCLSTLVN